MESELLWGVWALTSLGGATVATVLLALGLTLWVRVRRLEELVADRTVSAAPEDRRPAPEPVVKAESEREPEPAPEREPEPVVASVVSPLEPEPDSPASSSDEGRVEPEAARVASGGGSVERVLIGLGGVLGALLVLAGALFGVETAIEAGWLGPGTRVLLAALGGAGLWVGGIRLRRWQAWLGASVSGAGIGALFGALFASISLYGYVGTTLGVALSGALVALATLDGVRSSSRVLAHLAGVGAVLTPLVVADDAPSVLALFLWLLASAVVAAAAAAYRRWPDVALHLLGWLSLWSLYGVLIATRADQPWVSLGPALVAAPFAVAAGWRPSRDGAGFALTLAAISLPWVGLAFIGGLTPPWVLAVTSVSVGVASVLARRGEEGWPVAVALVAAMFGVAWAVLFGGGERGPADVGALIVLGLAVPMLPVLVAPKTPPSVLSGWPAVGVVPLILVASDPTWARWGMGATLVLALQGIGPRGLWAGEGAGRHVFAVVGASLTLSAVANERWWRQAPQELVVPAVLLALWASWGWMVGPARRLPASVGVAGVVLVVSAVLSDAIDRAGGVGWWAHGVLGLHAAVVVVAASRRGVPLNGGALGLVGNVGWALVVAALAEGVDLPWRAALFGVLVVGGQQARLAGHAGSTIFVVLMASGLVGWGLFGPGHPGLVVTHGALGVVVGWGLSAAGLGLAAAQDRTPWARALLGAGAVGMGFVMINLLVGVPHAATGASPWADPTLWTGTTRSLAWGAYGGALLALGSTTGARALRVGGFGFVLLGAAKVFAVDLWSLSGIARVFSALGLGGTLLVAAIGLQWMLRRSSADAPGEEASTSTEP